MKLQTNEAKLSPGFISRPPVMADAEAVAAMINQWAEAVVGGPEITPRVLLNDWEDETFDFQRNARLVQGADGSVAGFADLWNSSHLPTRPYMTLRVRLGLEGHAVARNLMSWIKARSRQMMALAPPEARVTLVGHNPSEASALAQLYGSAGMQVVRHSFHMQIDLSQAASPAIWPEGIRLESFDPETELEAVYRAESEAFEDHYGFIKQPHDIGFEKFKHHFLDDEGYDPELWLLAKAGDEIVGASLSRTMNPGGERNMAWIRSLSVRRPWRRRGIGLALLHTSFGLFRRRGYQFAGLGVDADSLTGAVRLYERAGMHVQRRFDRYEKELRPGVELGTMQLAG
jgi:ribosomal protein S18 acetylase RimI-like enzyme